MLSCGLSAKLMFNYLAKIKIHTISEQQFTYTTKTKILKNCVGQPKFHSGNHVTKTVMELWKNCTKTEITAEP